jgi:hypothetical protein
MIRVDEPIRVKIGQNGTPIGFWWRGASYQVTGKPERWFSRRNWWVEASRVHRGIGSGVLEVEMWRLSASKETTAPAWFELVHTSQDDNWQLVRIFG